MDSERLVFLRLYIGHGWGMELRGPLASSEVNGPEDLSFSVCYSESGRKGCVPLPGDSACWWTGLWLLVPGGLTVGKEIIQGAGARRALERIGCWWGELKTSPQGVSIKKWPRGWIWCWRNLRMSSATCLRCVIWGSPSESHFSHL